jgi:DNA polymerase-3 subunit gamma/tau
MIEKKENGVAIGQMDLSNMPRNTFALDDLKMAWRRFAFEMKNKGKDTFYNALIKREPKQKSELEFTLEVDNEVQIDYIRPCLSELLDFVRSELKNYQIEVLLELTNNPEEEVQFQTGKDKFAALARKNPNLHTLKNTFNLDIEY